MGQQFRHLFRGAPPEVELTEPTFGNVRHVRIPAWTDEELAGLLAKAPQLAAVLDGAPAKLRDLATVPFNTRLLSDLLADGVVASTLTSISSQAELLRLYWSHRVEHHGLRAEAALRRIVQVMVDARALRAPRFEAAQIDPEMVERLIADGVLIEVERRWLQFRHHLLFDFAAGRLFLEPSDLVSGAFRFAKSDALGLMLAPALTFVLQEVWASEANHARFWTLIARILADDMCDPVVRGAAGRISAEFPEAAVDAAWIAQRVGACCASAVRPRPDARRPRLSRVSGRRVRRDDFRYRSRHVANPVAAAFRA